MFSGSIAKISIKIMKTGDVAHLFALHWIAQASFQKWAHFIIYLFGSSLSSAYLQ